MFITLDAGTPRTRIHSPWRSARACDQCKSRKVKCNSLQPCTTCNERGFSCTYQQERKKRGPAGKRIAEIQRHQEEEHSRTEDREDRLGSRSLPINEAHDRNLSRSIGESSTLINGNSAHRFSPDASTWPARRAPPVSQTTGTQMPQWTTPSEHISVGQRSSAEDRYSVDLTFWATRSSNAVVSPLQNSRSGQALGPDRFVSIVNEDDYIFPSLPVESPSSAIADAFGSIQQHDLPRIEQTNDVWPAAVNEQTLLPWIDVYFKRLHPTIPILNRANMYHEMLLRKHRTDPQYGAMLLGLAAFAMEQPVQIHERAMIASRSGQSRMLLEECAKMRVTASFGEEPTIDMILTSFFMFACLFGAGKHGAARHRLREAVDQAYSLGLHLPQSYHDLSSETREKWLRTYLVLSVTERAYALQRAHSIGFRGRPGVTARFMQAFDSSMTDEYISSLILPDRDSKTDAISMTGLLYMMDSFDAIDESIMDCWNGYCRLSDGICDSFDRRRAIQMFRAQHRIREACLSGNISFAPSVAPMPLSQLLESQRADIVVTQLWLQNRLWLLCFSHGLLREISEHKELSYNFACQIAQAVTFICESLSFAAMEVHGLGFLMKIYDIATGMVTAVQASANTRIDSPISLISEDDFPGCPTSQRTDTSVQQLFLDIGRFMKGFRGGDHQFNEMLDTAIEGIMAP